MQQYKQLNYLSFLNSLLDIQPFSIFYSNVTRGWKSTKKCNKVNKSTI